jgi:hypothetical protein
MVNFIRQNLLANTESGDRLLADNGAICWKTLFWQFCYRTLRPLFYSFPPVETKVPGSKTVSKESVL